MSTVVHLFEGNRGNRPHRTASRETTSVLGRAWIRVRAFAALVAEVARESHELEMRLLTQGGKRRFLDH